MTRQRAKPNRLLALYQRQHPTVKQAVIAALLVLALHGAAGYSLLALALFAALVLWLTHRYAAPAEAGRRPPWTDDEDLGEEAESLAGELVYQSSLEALQSLLTEQVAVIIGTIGGRATAMLEGPLTCMPRAADGTGEDLFIFVVGEHAVFYVDRAVLTAPRAEFNPFDGGVEIVGGDGSTISVELARTADRA